jgi:hypothetical protein
MKWNLPYEKRAFRDFAGSYMQPGSLEVDKNNPRLLQFAKQPKVDYWSFLGTGAVNHVLNEPQ